VCVCDERLVATSDLKCILIGDEFLLKISS